MGRETTACIVECQVRLRNIESMLKDYRSIFLLREETIVRM